MRSLIQNSRTTRYYGGVVVLCVAVALLYYFLVSQRGYVELEVQTDNATIFKVYWAKSAGQWSERHVGKINLYPSVSKYSFKIGDLGSIKQLRFDTSERPATVQLQSIKISQTGYDSILFQKKEDFQKLAPVAGIENLTIDENGLTVVPSTDDPQLVFNISNLNKQGKAWSELFVILSLTLIIIGIAYFAKELTTKDQYVTYFLVFVLALVFVMASISKPNRHPDEFVHIYAGEYYYDHNIPPAIGDPDISHTYSNYGVSRLHSGEIVYLFAGKFGKILENFHLSSYFSLRMFNVFLLFSLIVFSISKSDFRVLLIPLLISPQIWYVFSYFDSDAFALFVVILSGYQLSSEQSMLNKALQSSKIDWKVISAFIACGVLFSLLLLLKKNFYFYYVFIFFYFLWRVYFKKAILTKSYLLKLLFVLAVGVSIFSGIRYVDYKVNDFAKADKLLEVREDLALEMYKPSTPLHEKHMYLQMKERGTTLSHFIDLDRWGEKSFRTSFGVYGYTSISAPFAYYDFVRIFGLLLLGTMVVVIFCKGKMEGVSLLSITLLVSLGLIIVALYHAWTVDFQAQGRYFLPIVGMVSVLLMHTRRYLVNPVFIFLLLGMYGLSVYNFVFVGLLGIEKYCFGII